MGSKEKIKEKPDIELSTLITNLPGIVYRSRNDKDWTMEFISEACTEITGYEPCELIENNEIAWAELIKPEDRERLWKEVQEAVKDDEPFKVTYTIITKDNEEKMMWEQGRAIRDSEGNIEALEGFITDITEWVEAEEKAEERENKVKKLYRATNRLQRCKTKQGVYKLALGAAQEILGFYTCAIFIAEEDELELKASTEKSGYEKGERFPLDEGLKGLCFRKKETYLVKDISNWEEAKPSQEGLRSGITVPIGDIGVLSTISNELNYYNEFDLEMAKLLASSIYETIQRIESEKEKSLILGTTEELIVSQDTDFTVRWTNQAAADSVDKDVEDLIGKKCYEIWHGREEPCEGCPVKKAKETGERKEGEMSLDDGRHWLIRASPELDEEGNLKGAVEVALDITERKKARERLKESKKRIEELMKATSQMEKRQDMERIYETAIDAVENIMDIDMGAIFVLEDDKLALKAETSGTPPHDIKYRDKDDGVAGKVLKTNEPDITNDFSTSEEAEPHFEEYRSGITIPIGQFGIFQGMSKETGHFDKTDKNMLELLAAHVEEARERVKLNEELGKSEEKYKSLFEDVPISLWEEDFSEVKRCLDDLKGSGVKDFEKYFMENPEEVKKFIGKVDINDINRTTLEIFRAESKEEIIDNFDKILRDEVQKGVIDELVAIANEEHIFGPSEFINYTLDDKKRYFYFKWTNIGGSKDFSKVIVSLVDITRLKETQRKLQKSEKKYRAIFENTGTAMMIIEEDKTVSLANEELEKVSGYTKEELEGEKWTEFVLEEDLEKMERFHEKRREEGEKVPNRYTFRGVTRFGDVRYFIMEIGIIPGTNKSVASLIDVTDYRKTFGALRESQEAFRILFENNREPVVLIEKDKTIREVNSKFLESFDKTAEGVDGKSWDEILHPDTSDEVKKDMGELLSGEKDKMKE
ncbi:MAG: PAS domain S-box protein, partial [Candidatus Thermoplasmatota archaeon]